MTIDLQIKETIKDDNSLKIFLNKVKEFDQAFCDFMIRGSNFTLSIEVRCNKSEL